LLSQQGLEFEERDFFKDLLSEAELEELMTLAPPSELFSWRSPSFRKMKLDKETLEPQDLVRLMAQEPRLIRRPMFRVGDRLVVGGGKKAIDSVLSGS
jgi:arsenate reductase-like glutaredoxin family protein